MVILGLIITIITFLLCDFKSGHLTNMATSALSPVRVLFSPNENVSDPSVQPLRLVPRYTRDNVSKMIDGWEEEKKKRFRMSHGIAQPGLTMLKDTQPLYDSNAIKAFAIGILGSVKPLSQFQLDGVALWLEKSAAELKNMPSKVYANPCWNGRRGLLCLPAAYVLGFTRCARVDLFYRITSHPRLVPSWRAEEKLLASEHAMDLGETVRNYGINVRLKAIFDKRILLVDGNPDVAWQALHPSLASIPMPRSLLVAQLIQRYTPNAKFLVILRDPVECALSYYVFRRRPNIDKPHDYHKFVEDLIHEVYNVTYQYGLDEAYGKSLLHENLLYWTYIMYLNDYFTFFPSESFYFITMKEYADIRERARVLNGFFKFLGVDPLNSRDIKILANMANVDDEAQRWYNADLKPRADTQKMIREFYQPFNEILAETMNDERFIWAEAKRTSWLD